MKEPSLQNEEKQVDSSGSQKPLWVVASQWGINLVGLTCLLGFGGYFIGTRLGGGIWSIGLMLLGLITGFSIGLYRMYKASVQMDKTVPGKGKPLDYKNDENGGEGGDRT